MCFRFDLGLLIGGGLVVFVLVTGFIVYLCKRENRDRSWRQNDRVDVIEDPFSSGECMSIYRRLTTIPPLHLAST